MDLNLFWFALLGILLAGYAILDGFDLGVGILHLFVRKDEERRIFMNSIGPIWDGNEVWLVTFGGAMFAAFPEVYATVFSGFYTAFMLLLFALIFRAVSMEFRSKRPAPWWRQFWDVSFAAGSTLATFLFGVAVGNAMQGMPIGQDKEFQGTTMDLLRPYPLLVGVLAVATFAMHGANLPPPENRRRPAETHPPLAMAVLRHLPGAVSLHHRLHAGGSAPGHAQFRPPPLGLAGGGA